MKRLLSIILILSIIISMGSGIIVNAANYEKRLGSLTILKTDRYTGNMGDSGTEPWIAKSDKDLNGKTYEHGLVYRIARWNYTNEISWAYNEYSLNENYKRFSGMLTICGARNGWGINEKPQTKMFVYGDGKLIYSSQLITKATSPQKFDMSVIGVKTLRVELRDVVATAGGTNFAIVNPILSTDKIIENEIKLPTFNNNTYQIFDIGMTWNQAKEYCESIGGHLATITSIEEQNFIQLLVEKGTKGNYWLGASDESHEGEWKWVTNEKFEFTNWSDSSPNNGSQDENFIGLPRQDKSWATKFEWNDYNNNGSGEGIDNFGFICEFENKIKVMLNGEQIVFDQQPISENGRTLVPMRAIFEAMGASVEWDNKTQTATGSRNSDKVSLQLNNDLTKINGKSYYLDVPAKSVGGHTLVPIRFIAEALGAYVIWDANNKTIYIYDNAEAKLISRVKAYTTVIPDKFKNKVPTTADLKTKEFKDYINTSANLSEVNDYNSLINSEMYVSYQFEKYLKGNLLAQTSLGLGKLVFNGDIGSYITLQSPEKDRYKKMLITYMKETNEQKQIQYMSSEWLSITGQIIDDVKDAALKNNVECKVAVDTIKANMKYFDNPNKTIDGMAERIEMIVAQEAILNKNGVKINGVGQIDSNAIAFLDKKYKELNKLSDIASNASYMIDIGSAGLSAYQNIVEVFGIAATYDDYADIFNIIEQKSNNAALKVAARELKEEMNSKLETLCNETNRVLGSTIVASTGLIYNASLSSLSDKVFGEISSSLALGVAIGSLISNIGFGTSDMIDASVYTVGYAQIAELLKNELTAEKINFTTAYPKSFEQAKISAKEFKLYYDTLVSIRLAGEKSYLSMQSYDSALLKTALRDMTDYNRFEAFCNESMSRLNNIRFR